MDRAQRTVRASAATVEKAMAATKAPAISLSVVERMNSPPKSSAADVCRHVSLRP
jgi:hypothetical protein